MEGKVAIEEHFSTDLNNKYWDAAGEVGRNGQSYAQDIERRLSDADLCIQEMDRAGIEMTILSLTSPGVQSVSDAGRATELAASSNDHAATLIAKYPGRFGAFATAALQNPEAAADEVQRCVEKLKFSGVLINGYSNVGTNEQVMYLDDPRVRVFWDRVSKLDIPVYLHPREPLASQTRSIQGYPELGGSAWAFGYETGSHAVRLMLSGLFDQYPNLKIILGHLGEALPYILPSMQHRLDEQREGTRGAKNARRPSDYFARNFWLTTSGHYHTKPLIEAIDQLGDDRVIFSVDYPYEQMDSAARWFDDIRLDNRIKQKVGRENANQLLRLGLAPVEDSMASAFSS